LGNKIQINLLSATLLNLLPRATGQISLLRLTQHLFRAGANKVADLSRHHLQEHGDSYVTPQLVIIDIQSDWYRLAHGADGKLKRMFRDPCTFKRATPWDMLLELWKPLINAPLRFGLTQIMRDGDFHGRYPLIDYWRAVISNVDVADA
jgi:hypothetical protein